MNEESFGDYGKGGNLEFTEQQKSEFKGENFGKVYPQYDSNELNDLYYSFSSLQENLILSKNEKYGVITLTSKSGIMDATLVGEQSGALEAKNSFINLLLKSTEGKEDILVKVEDSLGNTYLGIKDGSITYEME